VDLTPTLQQEQNKEFNNLIENCKLLLSFAVNKDTSNYDFEVVEYDYDYNKPPESIIINTAVPWQFNFIVNHLTATRELQKFLTWFCFNVLGEICCLGYDTTIDCYANEHDGWRLMCHRCGTILVDNMKDING
jgi:hypothetical protein